jgi:Epoxide hydrolase N terminus
VSGAHAQDAPLTPMDLRSNVFLSEVCMSTTDDIATEIRPFHVDIPGQAIDDLRHRIASTRLPAKELVEDRSRGVQLETIQELARYWATEYDWRRCEAKLNALPQFTTEIDRLDFSSHRDEATAGAHGSSPARSSWQGWQGSVFVRVRPDVRSRIGLRSTMRSERT